MKNIKVVTYATELNNFVKKWISSAEICDYDYTILGKGVKWSGWKQRTKAYLEFVQKLDPNQIVILCDAYDLLFVRSSTELHEIFLTFNKGIIVSAEPNCCTGKMDEKKNKQNFTRICKERAPINNNFIYPCAGCVIGYAGLLVDLYYKILNNPFYTDDQSSLGDIWIKNPDILTLDYESKMIGNIYKSDMKKKWLFDNNNDLYDKNTGNYPYVLHFPGSNNYKYYKLQYRLLDLIF